MDTEKSTNKLIFDWLKAILVAVVLIFLLRHFGFATSVVEGESMYPTLESGEKIIFNKLVYFLSEPDRGDIVIIQQTDKNYVKRVIGLPGERIEMRDHILYVDDEAVEEQFVDDYNQLLTGNFGPYELDDDHYFVVGDNRAISKDSRNGLGLIKREEIVGRSEFVIYPLDEWEITR